ncbi:MAG: 30S ribosomal protein S17, partial [Lapillicoccus sp.]
MSDNEIGQEDTVVSEADRNDRKTRQGYVVSDKMDKTVVVEV